jgi:hypothetical protein
MNTLLAYYSAELHANKKMGGCGKDVSVTSLQCRLCTDIGIYVAGFEPR